MATSFSWKRKSKPTNLSAKKLKHFSENDEEEKNPFEDNWLAKKSRICNALEDSVSKSIRLTREGMVLAEAERYWEAILRWDAALELNHKNEKIYEMKAQCLLELHEVFPAIQAAETAVFLNPQWSVAYQTLGRAQLAKGEIEMALKVFSKAVHLTPDNMEMWEEDLLWAKQLKEQKPLMEEKRNKQDNESGENG